MLSYQLSSVDGWINKFVDFHRTRWGNEGNVSQLTGDSFSQSHQSDTLLNPNEDEKFRFTKHHNNQQHHADEDGVVKICSVSEFFWKNILELFRIHRFVAD